MKAIFLTEGSKDLGFGHIARCVAIAEGLREVNIDCNFVINGDASINDLMGNFDYILQNWQRNIQVSNLQKYDFVFVDSYISILQDYKKISEVSKLLICLDDNNRINYPCDLLINGNIGANQLNYKYSSSIKLLLGTKYTPLRKVFWKPQNKVIKEDMSRILVSMGGSDVRSLSPKILDLLFENGLSTNVVVIIGDGFSQTTKNKLKDYPSTLEIINSPNSEKIREIMLNADLAISAGGQTLYELAKIGVPTIAITCAENQNAHVAEWAKTGFIKYVGNWNDSRLLQNIISSYQEIMPKKVRLNMSVAGKNVMSENGVANIIEFML